MPSATPAFMRDYGFSAQAGLPGLVQPTGMTRPFANSAKTAQVATIVVGTATNGATYTWVINGTTLTYTADGSTSAVEIAAGIVAAIQASPSVSADVTAVSDGVDTVTVTSRIAGLAFTISDSDAKITTTTTVANADSARIPFGYGLVFNGVGKVKVAAGTRTAAVAQVTEVTPTAVNSLTYILTVRMLSGTYSGLGFTATYIADGSATVQEIVEGLTAQINAMMPASTVIATEDNTKVILTAEVAGVGFEVDAGSSTTAVVTISTTTANVALSGALSSSFAGVAAWSHVADENYSHIPGALADGSSYPPDAVVNVCQFGPVHVRLSPDMSGLTVGDPVYLTFSDTGTGSAGDFRNTADSSYAVLLTGCRWTSAAYTDADGNYLAELTIDSLAG